MPKKAKDGKNYEDRISGETIKFRMGTKISRGEQKCFTGNLKIPGQQPKHSGSHIIFWGILKIEIYMIGGTENISGATDFPGQQQKKRGDYLPTWTAIGHRLYQVRRTRTNQAQP